MSASSTACVSLPIDVTHSIEIALAVVMLIASAR
jgi:hypothetical protein